MSSNRSVSKRSLSAHWLVLLLAVSCAVLAWGAWSTYGVPFFHQRLVAAASPALTNLPPPLPAAAKTEGPPEQAQIFAEYGQTGDAFGGLNALLTALAGAFVFWAGFMQHQALAEAHEELARERAYRQKQEFESLFFQLMTFSASAADKIELRQGSTDNDSSRPIRTGTRALDSFAASIYDAVNPGQRGATDSDILNKLMEKFYVKVYDRHPSAFGPYYRTLLRIYVHIASSNLNLTEQLLYAEIAKGQMSEGSLLLLALYGLTKEGHDFIPHIERYGLLEHMHRRHKRAYMPALLTGYSRCAFHVRIGDIERNDDVLDLPKLSPTYFDSLDDAREDADADADFNSGYSPNLNDDN